MSETISKSSKQVPLEAARGIAALFVVLHHFFLAFAPNFTGLLQADRIEKSIVGEWYFAIFNGSAAVYFFFVLSGYVLSISYLNSRNSAVLAAGILKRVPRLALPVVLSLVLTVALWKANLLFYSETSAITGSAWLASAGFGLMPAGLQPSYLDAVRQGLTTFFTGEKYYNSSIWTMYYEFFGSVFVFALIPLFGSLQTSRSYLMVAAFIGTLALFAFPNLIPFLVGMSLCVVSHKGRLRVPAYAAFLMLGMGLYLLGFVESIEYYAWLSPVEWIWGGAGHSAVLLNTLGSALIVAALVGAPSVSRALGGRIGLLLGRLSFPIYLVHVPIILSFSCFALVRSLESGLVGWTALNVTLAATFVVVVLAALPLAVIDAVWVRLLGRAAAWIVGREARPANSTRAADPDTSSNTPSRSS